jgi:cysteine sulfinate desulfinase/cysteine desulfurase-like protein
MGFSAELASTALRFSLGRSTTPDDVEYVLARLPEIVARVRG